MRLQVEKHLCSESKENRILWRPYRRSRDFWNIVCLSFQIIRTHRSECHIKIKFMCNEWFLQWVMKRFCNEQCATLQCVTSIFCKVIIRYSKDTAIFSCLLHLKFLHLTQWNLKQKSTIKNHKAWICFLYWKTTKYLESIF